MPMKLMKFVILGILALGLAAAMYLFFGEVANQEVELPPFAQQFRSENTISTLQSTPIIDENEETPDPKVVRINPIDGAELVFVPEGEFQMGVEIIRTMELCLSFRDDCLQEDFTDEEPVHTVILSGFLIYRQEISNRMYRLCVDQGSCQPPTFSDFYTNESYLNHPVVYVDWYEAADYCAWADGRLPTEAEWEKAARGDDQRFYPWGEDVNCQKANYKGCFVEMTNPVDGLPDGASSFGVLNQAGNVSEWTADWYGPDYYSLSPNINPAGPDSGELKVIRGGSWKNLALGLRTTNRAANFPEIFSTGIGFRCVQDGE